MNMFPSLYIVTDSFLDSQTMQTIVGGTESYTSALADLAVKNGARAIIYQRCKDKIDVAVNESLRVLSWSSARELQSVLERDRKNDRGVLVYYGFPYEMKKKDWPNVRIQHGVGADGASDPYNRSRLTSFLADIRRNAISWRNNYRMLKQVEKTTKVLCVDTNFINQMRRIFPIYDFSENLIFIPNFGPVIDPMVVENKWKDNKSRIVVSFARRFEYHRGVYLWADCVESLAARYPDVEFRFVGFGQGEKRLATLKDKLGNVRVYCKEYKDMQEEHMAAHIQVVPSLWSEGTSLSCVEGMSCGCAMVTSDVGGLGNLVIQDFNGLIIPPNTHAFRTSVEYLINNMRVAQSLGLNACRVAFSSFAKNMWESRVSTLLAHAVESPEPRVLQRRLRSF